MTTFDELIDNYMVDVFTVMPGQVTEFNSTLQTVSVQPCFKRKYTNQDPTNLPVIQDVPVAFFGSGNFWNTVDISVDSYCILLFSQRSLAEWLNRGGVVDPVSNKMFDKSDAIALFGINPLSGALSGGVQADSMEMRTRDRSTHLKLTDGTIELNGAADFVTAYNDMKTAFDQLKSDFDNLVGVYNVHTQAVTGATAGAPNPPIPPLLTPTPSTADMSGAKVTTVKVP